MALSDSCFDFLENVAKAAAELGRMAHHYSDPGSPFRYSAEIDALRRACVAVADAPYDPEAGARLMRLAVSVMTFHDTPPSAEEFQLRRAKLDSLVEALQGDLDQEDAAAVAAVIDQVTTETPFTPSAARRLRTMLTKVSKPAYDLTIKILGDVGAATVKRMLGL